MDYIETFRFNHPLPQGQTINNITVKVFEPIEGGIDLGILLLSDWHAHNIIKDSLFDRAMKKYIDQLKNDKKRENKAADSDRNPKPISEEAIMADLVREVSGNKQKEQFGINDPENNHVRNPINYNEDHLETKNAERCLHPSGFDDDHPDPKKQIKGLEKEMDGLIKLLVEGGLNERARSRIKDKINTISEEINELSARP